MTALLVASVSVHETLRLVVQLYVVILFARALLSWFPVHAGSPLLPVVRILDRLTEPVLAPLRRLIPPVRAGAMAIDLSFIVAIVALEILASYV